MFLLAKDNLSYSYASNNQENLQSLLAKDGRILRQNDVVECTVSNDSLSSSITQSNGLSNGHATTNHTLSYQVTLTEPVLQGYISELTSEIIVLPPLTSDSIKQKSAPITDVQANWQVDEDFLARGGLDSNLEGEHSIFPNHLTSETIAASSSTWQSPLSSPSIKSTHLDASISDFNIPRTSKGRLIRVMACSYYMDDEDLTPLPDPEEDEHTRAFVRATDLAKLGLFSGDRVVIQGLSSESKRVVRVYGLRRPPPTPDR